jgi:polyisoprenyl-phosphate glycosyltransferase
MKISVIVPVFNGGEAITFLYNGIIEREKIDGYSSEFILLFDYGNEESMKILHELHRLDPGHVKNYYFKENYGQHKALLFGISKSTGDFIITMDDDLQQGPEDIIKLLNKQKEGNYDIVYGNYMDHNHSFVRNIASLIVKKLLLRSIKGLYKGFSSFRLMKRDVANRLLEIRNRDYDFIDANLGQLSSNISETDVFHKKSQKPESAYSGQKLIRHFFLIMLTYSRISRVLLIISGFSIIISSGLLIFPPQNQTFSVLGVILGFIGGLLFLTEIILLLIKIREERKYIPIDSINYTE